MQVYTPQTGYCADAPIVLALGNFDGVHVGHAALLRRATAPCSRCFPAAIRTPSAR